MHVVMDGDPQHSRSDNGSHHFAVLRDRALNLLQKEPSKDPSAASAGAHPGMISIRGHC